ncbi:hypothetical protein MSAN_02378700 [Mycena sanguinolenta]|uniref:Protein kinase domain-containing protein n=1 Tax=Mycena sanguinolenta TaxID=230812 RepID=A0A8H6X4J4_9AGAR|nr:hypothetical protein MSAN_02378700 [Mycena sanguinolenta]
MDPQANPDAEFIVVSTSDYTESASYPGAVIPHASKLARNGKLFAKSFGFLSSCLAARGAESGTAGTHTRKYSETKPGRQSAEQLANNYNYYVDITGGFGGSGGEGRDQGGDGGTGQGPTVYFGQPQVREPSAFRTIQLGDINLIKEFKEMRSSPRWSVVGRQTPGATVRRVYTAKLERRESGHMTVALYEGEGAEEAWNQHLANYGLIRHPNIMQLYGLLSTRTLRGMVFHDELIPYAQFLRRFQHLAILTPYIISYCPIIKVTEFEEATIYISNVFSESSMDYEDLPVWIRPSTGQLCLGLAETEEASTELDVVRPRVLRSENISLDAPDSEDILISSLSEAQYHELCSWYPIARFQYFQISTEHPVGPGVFQLDSQHGTCVRITKPLQILPKVEPHSHWEHYGVRGEPLPNSWMRYEFPRTCTHLLELEFASYEVRNVWVAQANHIFAELEDKTHVENYVCIDRIGFILRVLHCTDYNTPAGYLFVCPPQDFHTGAKPHANLYQWPACPAYWSLDPSGADHLSTEDARSLGFPAIHIETRMAGTYWDHSVYEGLRQFHEGKGFDPYSQEVARQLGYPLYEVLSDLGSEVPFPARCVEKWRCEEEEDPALCRDLGHYL